MKRIIKIEDREFTLISETLKKLSLLQEEFQKLRERTSLQVEILQFIIDNISRLSGGEKIEVVKEGKLNISLLAPHYLVVGNEDEDNKEANLS